MPPTYAVVLSGCLNGLGVFLGGTAVAMGIISLLPVETLVDQNISHSLGMVAAILLTAIFWNLVPRDPRVKFPHAGRFHSRLRHRDQFFARNTHDCCQLAYGWRSFMEANRGDDRRKDRQVSFDLYAQAASAEIVARFAMAGSVQH
ncbi:MAG: hypothetical protein WCK15_12490 [Pirellula sp.]